MPLTTLTFIIRQHHLVLRLELSFKFIPTSFGQTKENEQEVEKMHKNANAKVDALFYTFTVCVYGAYCVIKTTMISGIPGAFRK